MKHINSFILILLIISITGCETKTDKELNQEENQVPQLNTQQQDNQEKNEENGSKAHKLQRGRLYDNRQGF